MEQETTKVMKAKDYKRAGKAEAVSYIQRKKSVKGDERKAVVKEQKQKIKDWKSGLKALEKNKARLTAQEIRHDENVAKLSIVGAGMATNPGVASLFFEAVYDAGVNIHMISTSEIKITVLVDRNDVDAAMVPSSRSALPSVTYTGWPPRSYTPSL